MVKIAKRRYWRRSRKAMFYKAISNYHATKLTAFTQIALDSTGIKFTENNSQIWLLSNALAGCSDWKAYSTLFISFKLRGLRLTVVPNPSINDFDYRGTAALGYVATADGAFVADTLESNKSLVLSPLQTVSCYWPLNGGTTGWTATNTTNQMTGKLQCASSSNASSGGVVFSMRVDFYIIYKNTI